MNETNITKTGDLIKYHRKEKRISQKELAEKTGLSIGTIQGYEQGRYKPKRVSLEKIAEALEINVEKLLGDDISKAALADLAKNFGWQPTTEEERKELEKRSDELLLRKIKALPDMQQVALNIIIEGLFNNSQDADPDKNK